MGTIAPRTLRLKKGLVVAIRPMTPADAPALHEHLLVLAREGRFMVTEEDETPGAPDLAAKIARHTSQDNDLILAATLEDGTLIGDLLATGGDRRRVAHRVRFGLSVARPWRDAGVGRALISTLLGWARDHETVEKVVLGVFSDNARAIGLYRSLGFRVEGHREREIRLGPGRYADDVLMALFVKDGSGARPAPTWREAGP